MGGSRGLAHRFPEAGSAFVEFAGNHQWKPARHPFRRRATTKWQQQRCRHQRFDTQALQRVDPAIPRVRDLSNLATNPGNGTSDYLFTLDAGAVAAFNAAFAGNTNDFIALDSTIRFANQSAGPDSYSFVNLNPGPTASRSAEPSSFLLLGTGLAGTAGIVRRRLFGGQRAIRRQ